jgi:t-SNARE complex subunit (syntaxin)
MVNTPIQLDSDDLNLSHDSDRVNRVLENIEQMHPRYLAKLLRNGDLAKVIRQRVDWYQRTMARLQRALPNERYETLDAKARDCLGGTNQNWQIEQPLTKAEAKMLRVFREEYRI